MTLFNRFLGKRECFVFGSNSEGRHGLGAAREALLCWGARYGQARGLQGDSYSIVTKELRPDWPAVTIESVADEVAIFIRFARRHPDMVFRVTKLGCGLAGFVPEQIAPLFAKAPDNVLLPDEFKAVLKGMENEWQSTPDGETALQHG